ncbi:cyclopropane-fatty-acyl-phospholipid synthase [Candidatus Dependentiae bacterium Noda2021]|nr:cyclopropane-fatty-acyl-phospholipid synthase [Candidatus Dependentiae bacterium Noda2021]
MKRLKKIAHDIADSAGITINGNNPWDIHIHDDRFYQRVIKHGSLGMGESFMDGWWDCKQLDECIARMLKIKALNQIQPSLPLVWELLRARLLNLQSKSRAYQVGEQHYDLGNDLYEKMLDKRLVYTCAYWKDARNLDDAQEAKLDLVCRKLHLKPGQKVLDIGCGWGSFAKFAAENYGAHVVGITIAQEQVELGKKLCHGLPVEIRLQDYRDLNEQFDHIISLGMFEHVGYKNYRTYMEVAQKCLKPHGLFLLHTIGTNVTTHSCDPWLDKYIFPNGMLPSVVQIGRAIEGLFVMEDWHNFSAYYDTTLMAWYDNVQKHWSDLQHRYSERFKRMWDYYLLSCAGIFRARHGQLWQIVLSKDGVVGGYESVR